MYRGYVVLNNSGSNSLLDMALLEEVCHQEWFLLSIAKVCLPACLLQIGMLFFAAALVAVRACCECVPAVMSVEWSLKCKPAHLNACLEELQWS